MPQTTGENPHLARLTGQLDRLIADGCCDEGDMIVFPVTPASGALVELARSPGVTIERIGPDVVRVRRAG